MNVFQFYVRAISHHPFKISGMVLGDAIQAVFMLMIPYALKGIIDRLEIYDPAIHGNGWSYMGDDFIWFIFVVLGQEFGARLSGMCMAFLAGVLRLKPRKEMVSYLQTHSMNFFQNMHSGGLGARINEACTGFGFSLWAMIFDIWPVLIKVGTSITLLFLTAPYLGWILVLWFAAYLLVMMFVAAKQFYWSTEISRTRSNITGKVVDMATNIYAVKSYANEIHEARIIDEASDQERQTINKFQIFREGGRIFGSGMAIFILIFMGHYCVEGYLTNSLSLGDISFIIAMMVILISNIESLLWGITHFLEYLGQTREGVRTIYGQRTVQDDRDAQQMTLKSPSILFKNASFSYPEKPGDAIFNALNLTIPAGQKVGLVGSSGAGKSTLLNLIMRFYDLSDGEILIDGQNIAHVTQESLRRHIAVIPQDTSLFHRTLMDNIRYGRLDATDDDVIAAAKKASAHDFITALPEGYDTLVGERGVKLSGGQRQRIAIARAILKDAPILILDEATSALDSESERAIQESLKDLMQGKTVIAIAHRLSTIAHLDRLIVMDDGHIIEDGTHEDLLKNDGHYATLWGMQSGGFLKS